jgi:hypothetical protein
MYTLNKKWYFLNLAILIMSLCGRISRRNLFCLEMIRIRILAKIKFVQTFSKKKFVVQKWPLNLIYGRKKGNVHVHVFHNTFRHKKAKIGQFY